MSIRFIKLAETPFRRPLQNVGGTLFCCLPGPGYSCIAKTCDKQAQTINDVLRNHFDGDLSRRMPSAVTIHYPLDKCLNVFTGAGIDELWNALIFTPCTTQF